MLDAYFIPDIFLLNRYQFMWAFVCGKESIRYVYFFKRTISYGTELSLE
jgi:hypothetical protein